MRSGRNHRVCSRGDLALWLICPRFDWHSKTPGIQMRIKTEISERRFESSVEHVFFLFSRARGEDIT